MVVTIAGRSIPGRVFRTNFAVPIKAPVLPQLTQASAVPLCTRLTATRIEESFFMRIACAADSSIVTTSEAWCTSRRSAIELPSAADDFFNTGFTIGAKTDSSPTRIILMSAWLRTAATAAATAVPAPRSPLIASSAMVTCSADTVSSDTVR